MVVIWTLTVKIGIFEAGSAFTSSASCTKSIHSEVLAVKEVLERRGVHVWWAIKLKMGNTKSTRLNQIELPSRASDGSDSMEIGRQGPRPWSRSNQGNLNNRDYDTTKGARGGLWEHEDGIDAWDNDSAVGTRQGREGNDMGSQELGNCSSEGHLGSLWETGCTLVTTWTVLTNFCGYVVGDSRTAL